MYQHIPSGFLILALFLGMLFSAVEAKGERERFSRIQKLNFVWDKAQPRVPSAAKLKKLSGLLLELEDDYLHAKQASADGKDPSGALMRAADKQLKTITQNFQLEDVLDSLELRKTASVDWAEEESKASNTVPTDSNADRSLFKHKKLGKLWNRALDAGFSEEELASLKEEFLHQQAKMDSLDAVFAKEPHPNSVLDFELDNDALADDERKKKKAEFKTVQLNLEDLGQKIDARVSSSEKLQHPRVRKIWDAALKSGDFSEQELASLQEELAHFQAKLHKLDYIRQELSSSDKSAKKHGNKFDDESDVKDRGQWLKKYAYGVDKLEKYLFAKVSHTEL